MNTLKHVLTASNRIQTFVFILLLAVTALPRKSTAQAGALKEELTWSQQESEIQSARFSTDGRHLLVVTRVHWPDGDEAESLPDSFFRNLEHRRRQDPRFADSVIRLIDMAGTTVCEVRYGTNPTLSEDGKKLVYARQKKPLTGKRSTANTMAGNDIQVYDCDTKRARTIATTASGYLDNPEFLGDGSVIYTVNEAVNGSWGGPVAIQRVDFRTGGTESLLNKQTAAAIPCSTSGMCNQNSKVSDFSNLLFDFGVTDGSAVVLQGKPLPAPGDMYLASRYLITVRTLFPKSEEILSFGEADLSRLEELSLQPISKRVVLIFSGHWRPFSFDTKTWLSELGPKNTEAKSIYSPNMYYYAVPQPSEEGGEPDHFSVYRSSDGSKFFSSQPVAGIYSISWSADGSKLAVVARAMDASGAKYCEVLHVYSLR